MDKTDRIADLAIGAARLQQEINAAGFGPPMSVVKLSLDQARIVAEALSRARSEVLVATDPIDGSFKVKIDGRTWSPPFKDRTDS